MPLSQKHRTTLFQTLAPTTGEEAIEALLSQFPATEADEVATKSLVREEAAELRTEIVVLRGEMREELANVRGEMREELANVRGEMHELRGDVHKLLGEMHKALQQQVIWFTGAIFTAVGVAVAIGTRL